MTEKGRIQQSKFAKRKGDKAHGEDFVFIMVTALRRFGTEIYNIKQEEPEEKPIKANQNKENRNTRTKDQWKH
mgnify:CR=1 FL=1